jgi:hypothetical protein
MSFHKKHQSLQTIKVGCDSSRIHLQKKLIIIGQWIPKPKENIVLRLRSQVALHSQMSSHKRHKNLQATKVGCDSSRIHLQKIDKHWTMDTKTQVKGSPSFVANQNGKIEGLR